MQQNVNAYMKVWEDPDSYLARPQNPVRFWLRVGLGLEEVPLPQAETLLKRTSEKMTHEIMTPQYTLLLTPTHLWPEPWVGSGQVGVMNRFSWFWTLSSIAIYGRECTMYSNMMSPSSCVVHSTFGQGMALSCLKNCAAASSSFAPVAAVMLSRVAPLYRSLCIWHFSSRHLPQALQQLHRFK